MLDISMLRSKCLIDAFFNGCIGWQYSAQVFGESFDTDSFTPYQGHCLLLEQKGAETKRRTADELKKLQVDLLVARNFHIDKQ